MENNLFSKYAAAIRTCDLDIVTTPDQIPSDFLLGQNGSLTSHYIPFDHVNSVAKLVLVGITPGFSQWKTAMREAQRQLRSNASLELALLNAKRTGGFSGTLRPNLVALLDRVGMHRFLKISSCDTLFGQHNNLVQTTSILRHPVFLSGKNYSGAPGMVRTPFLKNQILEHFAKEVAAMHDPVYVPLGPKVSEGLAWLASEGVIRQDRVLDGLPHPSGANAERIAYFLGRKKKQALSIKTNADSLDATRALLLLKIAAIS